jgi:hypothetical protein
MFQNRLSIPFSLMAPDPDAGKLDALAKRKRALYKNEIQKHLFSNQ